MAGDVRVDDRAGVDAVFGIDGAARSGAACGPEKLPVCVSRGKSATDSGMKSATDSDLISAIPI